MSEPTRPITLEALRGHELDALIGEGGMGQVHRAVDRSLGRPVALKVLRKELAGQPEVVARFVDEARLAATLEHPNILPVHAVGLDEDGLPAISMKLIEGISLYDKLQQSRRALVGEALHEVVDALIKVCEALGQAHDQGVIHGDIKARNVMLGEHGVVYLVDWGNAREAGAPAPLDARGQPLVLGTPAVMSPEQARGGSVDAHTDVFGMGALLYTVLARRVPYGRGGTEARIDAAKVGRCVDIERAAHRAPVALRRVVERAMRVDPELRHPSIEALRDDLLAWSRGQVSVPERQLDAGEVLITQGDEDRTMFLVVEGRLEVSIDRGKGPELINEMGPGEAVGELGLFARDRRTATVTALTPCRVRVIDPELVDQQMSLVAPWLRSVVELMAARLHAKASIEPKLD